MMGRQEMDGKETLQKQCTAIVLAGGSGSRMKSSVAKQFMPLGGKPVLWYSLHALQQSGIIDDCILVAGRGNSADPGQKELLDYVRREIVEKYRFTKVSAIVPGGSQRCWSVENAMAFLRKRGCRDGYILIHDSARPFLTEEILRRTYETARQYRACVAAMPSKDTVKLADGDGFAASTPDRSRVWTVQTPQVFEAGLILDAYDRLRRRYEGMGRTQGSGQEPVPPVTDDAGVVEYFTDVKVKLTEGSYQNIKITTPEDIRLAETFLAGQESLSGREETATDGALPLKICGM